MRRRVPQDDSGCGIRRIYKHCRDSEQCKHIRTTKPVPPPLRRVRTQYQNSRRRARRLEGELTVFASILAVSLALPPLPPAEFDDTETTTNVALPTANADARVFVSTARHCAYPSVAKRSATLIVLSGDAQMDWMPAEEIVYLTSSASA